jgi:hypothetical protein
MEQDNLCISWNSLPWKKFHRKSSSLQRKIYEAKQNENKKTIKRLQKLLLRSKSIYYIAVKSVTDYYSSKGIFLSKRIKSSLVNEVYLKLSKGKRSIIDIKLRVNFVQLNYLKDEVVAYVMDFLIKSIYKQNDVTSKYLSYLFNTQTLIREKRLLTLVFKNLLKISFLSNTSFRYLKSLLTVPVKYKSTILRSVTLVISNFYFYVSPLSFRVNLQSLYLSMVLLHMENSNLPHFLGKLNSGQEYLLSYIRKMMAYFTQIGIRHDHALFLCKRVLQILGLNLTFNTLKSCLAERALVKNEA